jgi:hypothetical protein
MKRMQPMQCIGIGRSSQGIEGYGGGSLWRRMPALGYSANEEEETYLIRSKSLSSLKCWIPFWRLHPLEYLQQLPCRWHSERHSMRDTIRVFERGQRSFNCCLVFPFIYCLIWVGNTLVGVRWSIITSILQLARRDQLHISAGIDGCLDHLNCCLPCMLWIRKQILLHRLISLSEI